MNELIITMNAYIDIFGNLILKRVIGNKKAIALVLKKALNDENIKIVITIKNRERAKRFLEYLESTVQ